MADETSETSEPNESNDTTPDADAPTEETAAVADAPAAAADETESVVTAPAAPPTDAPASPRGRSSLTVPTWAAVVAGVVVLLLMLGGSFAIGRETADDGGTDTQAISVPSADQLPRFPSSPDEVPRGVARAFFGVAVEAGNDGVAVLRVSSGSPAEDAGFKEGDVITKVDGTNVTTPAEFADAIHAHDPGDEAKITYTRDGSTEETTVKLQDRVQQPTPND